MKLFITVILVSFSFIASANNEIKSSCQSPVDTELSIGGDRRSRKARKNRRINKKRKRKCQQFSRRGFAG